MILADRFELLELAGAGGMGDVYRARDRATDRVVAVKLMRDRGVGTNAAKRFERESEAVEELRDPSIVSHVAHGVTAEGQLFLATEWLEGKTLAARLQEGRVSSRDALTIVGGTAEAVAVAHAREMVHRDLKPSNIFLCEGRADRVKLIDFGLVSWIDSVSLTQGKAVGTPAYMSPEQARGYAVDPRADVFALGCVLYECLTGRRAFGADTFPAVLLQVLLESPQSIEALRPDLPRSLSALVERMMSKSLHDRPKDGAAVAIALSQFDLPAEQGTLAASSVRDPVLTTSERRFQCVVLANPWDPDGDSLAVTRPVLEAGALDLSGNRTVAETDLPLTPLQVAARRCGGSLDRLLDGRLMVSFEARGTPKDGALAAARCALALAEVAPSLEMAIVAGWDIAGSSGHRGVEGPRDRVTALLDRVRAAAKARKEEDAAESGVAPVILVDPLIVELIEERYDVARETLADGAAPARFLRGARHHLDEVRSLLGQVRPFVGRAREMANLTALLAECCDESVARVVLVTGDAGMGKSRIRYELVRHARERGGIDVWIAGGDPLSEGSAFALLAQTMRCAAGIREGEPLEIRRAKLAARVERDLGEADRVTEALLGELIGAPAPEGYAPIPRVLREDPVALGDKMRSAFLRWLGAAVAARPVLLVLEDLHWGDLPTIRVLDDALAMLKDERLMLLALARPEVHALFPPLWARRDMQEMRLPALTRKACAALAQDVLGRANDVVVDRIAERAQGNAFFLEELIRAVAESRAEALPDTVLATMQRRIQAQSALARQILRAASVFGCDFSEEGVAELLGGQARRHEVGHQLAALVEAEMVMRSEESRFPGAGEFRFRHALLADAAYAMLMPEDRLLGHRLAAAWLVQRGEQDALVLAGHYERGGQRGLAAERYLKAAQDAHRGSDYHASLKHVGLARACGPSPDLEGSLDYAAALACWPLGRFAEAGKRSQSALAALPPTSAAWHESAMMAMMILTYTAELDAFERILKALLGQLVGDHIGPAHLHAWSGVVHTLFRMGRAADASWLARRVEERAEIIGGEIPAVPFVRQLEAHYATHEPEACLREARIGVQMLYRVGEAHNRDWNRIVAALALLEIGAPEEAEQELLELDATLDGAPFLRANTTLGLARAVARQGRTDEALALARRAVELFVPTGSPAREGIARMIHAEALATSGELAPARAEAARAVELLAAAPLDQAAALARLASIHLELSELDEALAAARRAYGMLDHPGVVSDAEATVRLTYGEALAASGDLAGASGVFVTARERLLARAATIADGNRRRSFLERVPVNARTLARGAEAAESARRAG